MAESLINYKIGAEKQILFLNQERVVGAQSLQGNQNFGLSPVTYAGIGLKSVSFVPRSEQTNSVSINSYLINKDYFFSFVTGNSLANLYILRTKNDLNNCYSFISGYCNNFTCNYSIGNVPEVSVNFIAVHDAGVIGTGSMPRSSYQQLTGIANSNIDITGSLLIPFGNSLVLTINSLVNTNRVQSFSLQVQSNKTPVYNMGSRYPKRIDYFGSDVSLNLSFELGDYEAKRLRDIPQSGIIKNLTISVNDFSTNAAICNYSFNNLNLISEQYENSINGFVTINQNYSTKVY